MLREITTRLLQTENHGEILRAATELRELFSGITKVSDDSKNPDDKNETMLNEGKALSPNDAARCIGDHVRTRSFLSGVRAAVIEAQRRFRGHTIHILYAGCGPFAPLVLPLTTEFTAAQVQFTLLDIHQRSLDSVREIVETLGLNGFVRDYVQCDATRYQHPRESAPHIVVTETMQRALAKEPQVAITCNLAPQLRAGGILVPQQITLSACLADLSREFTMTADGNDAHASIPALSRARIELGRIFELTAESSQAVREWTRQEDGAASSPPVTLRVPPLADEKYRLMILTKIKVFDAIVLEDYDAGLTYPVTLNDLGFISSHAQIEFRYVTGKSPGLRYRLL
jgi:hypothetical protein